MALNVRNTRKTLKTCLLGAIFLSLFFTSISALALGNPMPAVMDFSKTIQKGDAGILQGVYVTDVMALPVVQQPPGNAAHVSDNDGEVTQFQMASRFGNIGLLAHNHLSGRYFSQLETGQEVRLVYGNGHVETFVVTEVLRYQALQPASPHSSFRRLDDDETLSAEGMFKRVYLGDRHVTFQTCIEREGELSWGRLFVIAVPKSEVFGSEPLQ